MTNDDIRVLERCQLDKMHILNMLEKIQFFPEQKVLDIGCSLGGSTEIIKQRYPFLDVYGIDINSDSIIYAQQRSPDITYQYGDCCCAPFDAKFFDVCFARMLFETMDANLIDNALNEMKRITKQDGYILIYGNLRSIPDIFPKPRHYYEYLIAEIQFSRLLRSKIYSPTSLVPKLKQLGLKDVSFCIIDKNSINTNRQDLHHYYIEERNYGENPLVRTNLISAKVLEEYETDLSRLLLDTHSYASFLEYCILGQW